MPSRLAREAGYTHSPEAPNSIVPKSSRATGSGICGPKVDARTDLAVRLRTVKAPCSPIALPFDPAYPSLYECTLSSEGTTAESNPRPQLMQRRKRHPCKLPGKQRSLGSLLGVDRLRPRHIANHACPNSKHQPNSAHGTLPKTSLPTGCKSARLASHTSSAAALKLLAHLLLPASGYAQGDIGQQPESHQTQPVDRHSSMVTRRIRLDRRITTRR